MLVNMALPEPPPVVRNQFKCLSNYNYESWDEWEKYKGDRMMKKFKGSVEGFSKKNEVVKDYGTNEAYNKSSLEKLVQSSALKSQDLLSVSEGMDVEFEKRGIYCGWK